MSQPIQHDTVRQLEAALASLSERVQDGLRAIAEDTQHARQQLDAVVTGARGRAEQIGKEVGNAHQAAEALIEWAAAGLSSGEDFKQRIAELEAQATEAVSRAEAAARELETLSQENAALKQTKAALEQESATLTERIAGLEAGHLEKENALAEVRMQLAGSGEESALRAMAEAERDRLQQALDAKTRDYDVLREKFRDGLDAAHAAELRTLLDAERERAASLEQRVKEETARGTKSVLAAQLAEALGENEQLREEIHQLRKGSPAPAPVAEPAPPASERMNPEEEQERLRRALSGMRNGHKRTIGDILIDAGLITSDQLEEALEEQRRTPYTHLGAILAKRGFAGAEAIAQALAFQCNATFIRLADVQIEPEAAARISERLAIQHRCIPIRAEGDDTLVVALDNPLDLVAIEDIERTTNRHVEVVVATEQDIRAAIERHYAAE